MFKASNISLEVWDQVVSSMWVQHVTESWRQTVRAQLQQVDWSNSLTPKDLEGDVHRIIEELGLVQDGRCGMFKVKGHKSHSSCLF